MRKLSFKLKRNTLLCVAIFLNITLLGFFICQLSDKIQRQFVHTDQHAEVMKGRTDVLKSKTKLLTNEQQQRVGKTQNATGKPETCLAAVIRVRIYRGDKPELTTYELEQIIRYLQYAGVNVVYLYDTYENDWEKLEQWVKQLFFTEEVIYHDMQQTKQMKPLRNQLLSYKHAKETYRHVCNFHMAIDMDEYPFVIRDTEKGFLKRFVLKFTKSRPECSEISLPNYIFSGYPTQKHWLIERLQRRLPNRANNLDKPIYIVNSVRDVGLHHNKMMKGKSCDVDGESVARIIHYWGARIQNWEPDTSDTLSKTIVDQSVLPILRSLKTIQLISNTLLANVTNRFWNVSLR